MYINEVSLATPRLPYNFYIKLEIILKNNLI